jgi:hypothetical protein
MDIADAGRTRIRRIVGVFHDSEGGQGNLGSELDPDRFVPFCRRFLGSGSARSLFQSDRPGSMRGRRHSAPSAFIVPFQKTRHGTKLRGGFVQMPVLSMSRRRRLSSEYQQEQDAQDRTQVHERRDTNQLKPGFRRHGEPTPYYGPREKGDKFNE